MLEQIRLAEPSLTNSNFQLCNGLYLNDQKITQTSNRFKIGHEQVWTWIKSEEKIRKENMRLGVKTWLESLLPMNKPKASTTVPTTEEMKENSEKMVVSLQC